MPRATMADLITRTRDLIADPAGGSQRFTDDQVQVALDQTRTDILFSGYYELIGHYTVSGGAQNWTDYFDPYGYGDWESDAQLYNGSVTLLTPLTSDYLVGHWTFANQPPPVYIVGKQYDIYAAASILARQRAALEAGSFDVNLQRQGMMRSQKFAHWNALADMLAARARPRSVQLVRRDTHGPFAY